MSSTQKSTCFVIAPIGGKDTEIRKRSDQVLKHLFRKALGERFDVTRGDEIDEPGRITSQVLRAVQDSDLVVADLTGHNPNVFYELAVRHAVEKPVIHVIEPRVSQIPFDVADLRAIDFDLTDLDSIDSAIEKLRKQAEQALSGKWGETPIKLANIMRPTKEDSLEMRLLKQAVQGIAEISAKLSSNVDYGITRYQVLPAIGAAWHNVPATVRVDTSDQGVINTFDVVTPSIEPAAQLKVKDESHPIKMMSNRSSRVHKKGDD
jgi:hypothetical protein